MVWVQARMKETEKVMKQVDKEERRRSKQAPSSSLFSKAAKAPLAATPPVMPRYPLTPSPLCMPLLATICNDCKGPFVMTITPGATLAIYNGGIHCMTA